MTTLVSSCLSGIDYTGVAGDTASMVLLRAIYYTVAAFGLALGLVFLPQIIERFAAAPHVLLILAAGGAVLYPILVRLARPNPWRRSWWR